MGMIARIRGIRKDKQGRKEYTVARMNKGLKDYATNLDKQSDKNLKKLIKSTEKLKKLEESLNRPLENSRDTLETKINEAIEKESEKLEQFKAEKQELEQYKIELMSQIDELSEEEISLQAELEIESEEEEPDLYKIQELRESLKNVKANKAQLKMNLEKTEARIGMFAIRESKVRERTISRVQSAYREYNRKMQILGEPDLIEDYDVEGIDEKIEERLDEIKEEQEEVEEIDGAEGRSEEPEVEEETVKPGEKGEKPERKPRIEREPDEESEEIEPTEDSNPEPQKKENIFKRMFNKIKTAGKKAGAWLKNVFIEQEKLPPAEEYEEQQPAEEYEEQQTVEGRRAIPIVEVVEVDEAKAQKAAAQKVAKKLIISYDEKGNIIGREEAEGTDIEI